MALLSSMDVNILVRWRSIQHSLYEEGPKVKVLIGVTGWLIPPYN